jgi:hypothetical protein
MSAAEESVVLCEGFHDRAFWKGWLKHLGCIDLPGRAPFFDPFGKPVPPGHFAFRSASGAFVRLQSCGGDKGVLARLEDRLTERVTNALHRLVVNLDTDADDAAGALVRSTGLRAAVESRVAKADPAWSTTADGDLALDGGSTLVSTIFWCADDPLTAELPAKQTLERLVCAALRTTYPARGASVASWLAARSAPPPESPKEHAWSHMAGWYANNGCDDFYQAVWRDPPVAAQLEARLRAGGAWRAVEALVR